MKGADKFVFWLALNLAFSPRRRKTCRRSQVIWRIVAPNQVQFF
jgi:hypothetical protein